MNLNPAPTVAPASALGRRRSLIIPAALAGGLLLFGGRTVHAAGVPLPAQQFTIAGEPVTTSGSGFTTSFDKDGLRIVVGDGEAFVQLGSLEVIDLPGGADVTISTLATDDIDSINVTVATGSASLETLNRDGLVSGEQSDVPSATTLRAGDSLSFATGPDQSFDPGSFDENSN